MLGERSQKSEVRSQKSEVRGWKFFILFLFFFLFVGSVSAMPISKVYNIELSSVGGEVVLENLNLIEGYYNIAGKIFEGDYVVKIISHDGEIYNEYPFKFSYDVFRSVSPKCFVKEGVVDTLSCGESSYVKMNNSVVFLSIPFSPSAKFLRIYNSDGEMIIEKDVFRLSCGNLVCDSHESEDSCLEDCANGSYVFMNVMLVSGVVLFILGILTFVFWEYIDKQRKFKQKVASFCRLLKSWQN